MVAAIPHTAVEALGGHHQLLQPIQRLTLRHLLKGFHLRVCSVAVCVDIDTRHCGLYHCCLLCITAACCAGKSLLVAPIEDSTAFFAGPAAAAYGPWLLSMIDAQVMHTQAMVLVHTRKQAVAVEAQLQKLAAGTGVVVRSLAHCFTQTGPTATAMRESILGGMGPHVVVAPPYSAFNTAEQAPLWRESSRCPMHHCTGL